MLKKTISILAVLLLSGLLINGITMTQQLKKIQTGLEENIESMEKLNQVQASIIDKNEELSHMLITVRNIDQSLVEITDKTSKTLTLLSTVVDYNASSLSLNNQMVGSSNQSKEQIQTVQASLAELSPYLNDLDQLLSQLSRTADQDKKHLESILKSTETMNSKTPGVSRP